MTNLIQHYAALRRIKLCNYISRQNRNRNRNRNRKCFRLLIWGLGEPVTLIEIDCRKNPVTLSL
jgi:hypothetical protein